MLIQTLTQHPEMFGLIVKKTPPWVWGLLAALTVLGLVQARQRTASWARVSLLPISMTALSIWGSVSAFGASPLFGYVMLAWLMAAAVALAVLASMPAPRGALYDSASRRFTLPGSWVPMALIMGIFLTRYAVGIELAMQPGLARDGQFTLVVGALYGLFSGIFMARAARLWRLAHGPLTERLLDAARRRLTLQRDPW